jgi:hypothetical protein
MRGDVWGMNPTIIEIGNVYRFWLGSGFIRHGKVLGFDGDDIVIVRWVENGQRDYVSRDQLC